MRGKLVQGLRALERLDDPWAYGEVIKAIEFALVDATLHSTARKHSTHPWPRPCNELTAADLEESAQRLFRASPVPEEQLA